VYSTYLGGETTAAGKAIAVDPSGAAYITGSAITGSAYPDFPRVGTFPLISGLSLAFFAKLGPQPNPPADALAPVFSRESITSAADFTSWGVTRGGLSTLFGLNLTTVTGVLVAEGMPLPTELAGTSVTVNGYPAPILSIANVNGLEQITIQTSYDLASNGSATVVVSNHGVSSYAAGVRINYTQPRIFTVDGFYGAIQHSSDFSLVTPSNPARRGEQVVIYGTGLGPVVPLVPAGQPAPASPLSWVNVAYGLDLPPARHRVTINGVNAEILFQGLTPGQAGLYQINVIVPANTASGDAVVDFGGFYPVRMPVQ
jgi:uncharacterized protein (TIGR03437 family)